MDRELFVRYAQLKTEIAEKEQELKELNPEIIQALAQTEEQKVELTGYGKFSLYSTTKWGYTIDVSLLEQKVNEQKEQEQADGKAEKVETLTLRFTKDKE